MRAVVGRFKCAQFYIRSCLHLLHVHMAILVFIKDCWKQHIQENIIQALVSGKEHTCSAYFQSVCLGGRKCSNLRCKNSLYMYITKQ